MNAYTVICDGGTDDLEDHAHNIAITLLQDPRYADVDEFEQNAHFIARARTRWPAALAEISRLKAMLEAAQTSAAPAQTKEPAKAEV